LPYDIPVEVPEDLEVRGETNADDSLIQLDDDGQITLTLDKKKPKFGSF
jgi:topoisomerase-4 subunit A